MSGRDLFGRLHATLYSYESRDLPAITAQVDCCVLAGYHGITVLGLTTGVMKLD